MDTHKIIVLSMFKWEMMSNHQIFGYLLIFPCITSLLPLAQNYMIRENL